MGEQLGGAHGDLTSRLSRLDLSVLYNTSTHLAMSSEDDNLGVHDDDGCSLQEGSYVMVAKWRDE